MSGVYGIVCVDMDEFNSLNTIVWDWLVTNRGAKGEKWANPIIHPKDGRIAFQTKASRMGSALTQEQRDRVILLTDDWFVEIEE